MMVLDLKALALHNCLQQLSWQHSAESENNVQSSCIKLLSSSLQKLDDRWVVKPFGSSANGFSTKDSDLDLTCIIPGKSVEYALEIFAEKRKAVLSTLESAPGIEVLQEIWSARVPVVKMKFAGFLEVDLTFQNTAALVNTELLKAYSKMCPQLRDLGIAVKRWAKAAGVCGAPQGHLSSYSFTLMAIYFMQTCHGMPCLPTDAFSENGPAPNVRNLRWETPLPVSALLMQFCLFYYHAFQWGTEVVSPRLGCRMRITHKCFSWLETWGETRLHIEDPFILERNLNCVLGSWQEGRLREVLQESAVAMIAGKLPRCLDSTAHTEDTASTETPASGLADKTPALSSDAEDLMKPLTKEGRVETFGEDRIERLDSLRASPGLPPGLPLGLPPGPPGLPPGRFAPAPRPTRRAAPAGRTGLTAPEPSEVPSPALGARGAGVFGRPLKAPLAINTVEIVENDEAEVAEMAELLSNRVLRF